MITKHYKKALASSIKYNGNTGITVTDYLGSERALYSKDYDAGVFNSTLGYSLSMPKSGKLSNNAGVYFGTGTTAPTEDDYNLSGSAVDGLTLSAITNCSTDEDGFTSTATYTITNGNSEAVTITEIGCLICVRYASSSFAYVLADRTLLDSPVTIPAGGVGQVTYTIRQEW